MTSDWEVNLISEPFELKQNEYDCNSTFIIFLSKAGVDYDRDDFGDLILDYEEWGTIDPPGPNKGFGSKIDPDFLEELWDDECRSKLTIKKLKTYYLIQILFQKKNNDIVIRRYLKKWQASGKLILFQNHLN